MSFPFGMVRRASARAPRRRRLARPIAAPSSDRARAAARSFSLAQQPQIILLREGTDTSQGKPQLISNINACCAVADVVRTTLGPRGMDKLMADDRGVTISNDGATIMKTLQIVHPAAKTLVDISLSQDAEVGDGTTTVVLLAAEFLREAQAFIEEGVHPYAIVRAYRAAAEMAVERVRSMAVDIAAGRDEEERKSLLRRCAATSLNSKLVSGERDFFAAMVVEAVSKLDPAAPDLRMLGVKKVQGGGLRDSFLVDGVAFKKTFSYAGESSCSLALPVEAESSQPTDQSLTDTRRNENCRLRDAAQGL